MSAEPGSVTAATPNRVEFGYDDQSLRAWKKTYTWDPTAGVAGTGAWVLTAHRKFVYSASGQLIGEFEAGANGVDRLVRSFIWGIGGLGGAGGVGALLSITTYNANGDGTAAKVYLPLYDGQWNVVGLLDAASGTLVATYEYDPFGNYLSAPQGDPEALAANPFGFATQYRDAETGLSIFRNRPYSPPLQRWLTRDPIAENGGVNLYAYPNDPINNVDPLGCADQPTDGSSGLGVIDLLWGLAGGSPFVPPEARRGLIVDVLVASTQVSPIAVAPGSVCGDGLRQGIANNLAVAELQMNGLVNIAITGRINSGQVAAMGGMMLPPPLQPMTPDVPLTPTAPLAQLMGIDRLRLSTHDWSYRMYFNERPEDHALSMELATAGQFLVMLRTGPRSPSFSAARVSETCANAAAEFRALPQVLARESASTVAISPRPLPALALEPGGAMYMAAPRTGSGALNASRTAQVLSYRPSSGRLLQATPGKTTTILGSYNVDMKNVIGELGNVKSLDFGAKPGAFNVLNVPDELYVTQKQFWTEYNRPWLDAAIAREDCLVFATTPEWGAASNLKRINKTTGKWELSGFGREYLHLRRNGYRYDPVTNTAIRGKQ